MTLPEASASPQDNYIRQKWAIHLFEEASQLLETYELFPREIRLQVRDGEADEARTALIERYRKFPNIPEDQLEESADGALYVIIEGNKILSEMAKLHESGEEIVQQPMMDYEKRLLFHRSWNIALETPIEFIEAITSFVDEDRNA